MVERVFVREEFLADGGHRYVSSRDLASLSPKMFKHIEFLDEGKKELGSFLGIEKRFSLSSFFETGSPFRYSIRTVSEEVYLRLSRERLGSKRDIPVLQLPSGYHIDLPVSEKIVDLGD